MKNSCRPGCPGGALRVRLREVSNPATGSQGIAEDRPAVPADDVSMHFGDDITVPAGAPALIAPDRVWTYGEVDRTTAALARRLRARGVERGEAVAVLARRDASGISGVLASTRAGAAFLALDPDLPVSRLCEMIDHSGARHVLGSRDDLDRLHLLSAGILLPARPESPPAPAGWVRRRDDDPAYLVYTSGTTGRPKAVVTTCVGMRNVAQQQREILGVDGSSRIFQMAPVSFDAFIFEILMALGSGASLVLPPRRGDLLGQATVDRMRSERVTHLVATPTLLAALPASSLPDLTVVCSVGEACNAAVVAKWKPGRQMFNLYGPAESTVWATWSVLDSAIDPACIGTAIRGITAIVLDDDMRLVPPGSSGQLYLTGLNIALGYHSLGRLTAERFVPGPDGSRLYATGDIVTEDGQGNLRFTGRADRQIKVQGARVEPGEIESAILGVPGVQHAFVTSVHDDRTGRELLAAVYCAAENHPDPLTVTRALIRALPRWMVPQQVVPLDRLPLTPNGKTDERAVADHVRKSLRSQAPSRLDGDLAGPDDRLTATESKLLDLASAVLGNRGLAIDDNFIAAGGNSMLGMLLLAAVDKAFGVTLTMRALFEADTLRQVAESALTSLALPLVDSRSTAPNAECDSYLPSPGQLEILAAETFLGGSVAFLQPWCERIRGPFSTELFASAVRETVARHESLRTRYRPAGHSAGIRAVVDATAAVRHVDRDMSGGGFAAAMDFTKSECQASLRLDVEQPVRLLTVRVDDEDHVVTVTIHHVACDAVSFKIILDQVWQRYEEIWLPAGGDGRAGASAPTGTAGTQYSQFASRQRSFLDSAEASRQRRWWHRQLDGYSPLSLADRPADTRHRSGARIAVQIPVETVTKMERLCRELRLTPYSVLSAAFTLAMEPYLVGQGCVVGTPCDIRGTEFRETVGFLINTLPVRLSIPERGTVGAWLEQWQAECLSVLSSSGLPYGEIAPVWRSRMNGPSKLEVIFAVSYTDVGESISGAVSRERIDLDSGAVKNELIFTLTKRAERWTGQVIYDIAILQEAAATQLLDRFVDSLDSIAEAAGRDVSELFPARTRFTIDSFEPDFDLELSPGRRG